MKLKIILLISILFVNYSTSYKKNSNLNSNEEVLANNENNTQSLTTQNTNSNTSSDPATTSSISNNTQNIKSDTSDTNSPSQPSSEVTTSSTSTTTTSTSSPAATSDKTTQTDNTNNPDVVIDDSDKDKKNKKPKTDKVYIWLPNNTSPYFIDHWCWSCFYSSGSWTNWGYWIDNNFYVYNDYLSSFVSFVGDVYYGSNYSWYTSIYDYPSVYSLDYSASETIIDNSVIDSNVVKNSIESNNAGVDSNIVKYSEEPKTTGGDSNIVEKASSRKSAVKDSKSKSNIINNNLTAYRINKFRENLKTMDVKTKKELAIKELKMLKLSFFGDSNYDLKSLKADSKKYVFNTKWIQKQMMITNLAKLESKLKTLKAMKDI